MSLCTADVSLDVMWIKLCRAARLLPLSQSIVVIAKGVGGTDFTKFNTGEVWMGKVVLLITESPSKEEPRLMGL